MENSSKIEVCGNCSGITVEELAKHGKAKIGCIGKCARKNPDIQGKVYGFLNGEFTICDTSEEFYEKVDQLEYFIPNSNRNPVVDAFLEHVSKWKEEFVVLRELCLKFEFNEVLKWGQPCYTINDKNVIILGEFKEYLAMTFFKGILLKDEKSILAPPRDEYQSDRQFRFHSVNEIMEIKTDIEKYIREAISNEKNGMKLPDVKRPEMEIPTELQDFFDQDHRFQEAFYALTPGRRRGYLLFFAKAKKSETKIARIEKYMPKIFDGYGIDE